jgi:hypothetical protein
VHLLQLVADIFIDVLEGAKEGGRTCGRSGTILDSGAQVLFASVHQAVIGRELTLAIIGSLKSWMGAPCGIA